MKNWLRAWNLVTLVALPLTAPIHIGFDLRPILIPLTVRAIGRHENCADLKNPSCLRYAGQPGARPGREGYANFKTKEAGERAAVADVRAKYLRGWNVHQVVEAYNVSYLEAFIEETGLSPLDRLR